MERRTLGNYLRRGREEAGLTLESVALQTKVPRRTLQALEDDRLDGLPALVFVRGFVRAYCATVGIDPLPALDALESRATARDDLEGYGAGAAQADSRQPIYLSRSPADPHRGLRISHLVLVLIAVALFVAAYVISGSGGDDRGPSAAANDAPAAPGVQAPLEPGPIGPGGPRDTRSAPDLR